MDLRSSKFSPADLLDARWQHISRDLEIPPAEACGCLITSATSHRLVQAQLTAVPSDWQPVATSSLRQETSSFCLSEVKLGLIPAVISPYVVRAIGERQARRFFISAEVFNARDAEKFGLVHIVCDDIDAMNTRCDEMLQQLAQNGPEAMKAAKSLVFAVSHKPIDSIVIDDTAHRIADIRVGKEGQEGLSAFLNKRRANWIPESN